MVNSIAQIQAFLKERQSFGIKPGLKRMHLLLKALNHPERQLPIIHIAGTNGKGSTVEMIAQSMIANGHTVGVFSSPSFTGLTGHFLINEKPIKEADLVRLMNQILPIVERLDRMDEAPTEFEIITALAFLYFHKRVDLAIVEAGMGGRFDTTNSIVPIISIITTIALDHEQFLGDTLEKVAHHKAGIIKKNIPVIIGSIEQAAARILHEEASEKNSPIYSYGKDFFLKLEKDQLIWQSSGGGEIPFSLSLAGKHQRDNAALAFMALYILKQRLKLSINWQRTTKAMSNIQLRGRFETLSTNPTIIVDSAHNPAAMKSFIKTAQEYDASLGARVLFAGFQDKQLEQMIKLLIEGSFSVTVTTFNHERAANQKNYETLLKKEHSIVYKKEWEEVIEQFLCSAPKEASLYITGSLHFVMLVRQYLQA